MLMDIWNWHVYPVVFKRTMFSEYFCFKLLAWTHSVSWFIVWTNFTTQQWWWLISVLFILRSYFFLCPTSCRDKLITKVWNSKLIKLQSWFNKLYIYVILRVDLCLRPTRYIPMKTVLQMQIILFSANSFGTSKGKNISVILMKIVCEFQDPLGGVGY